MPTRPAPAAEDAPEEPPGPRSEVDAAWLAQVAGLPRANLGNPQLSVEWLAQASAMSSRTLQRALRRVTGKAPAAWLLELRIEAGQESLRRGLSVSEAAWAAGMSPSYFSRVYSARFGYPPSQELQRGAPS